jgi:hypothetical protein
LQTAEQFEAAIALYAQRQDKAWGLTKELPTNKPLSKRFEAQPGVTTSYS